MDIRFSERVLRAFFIFVFIVGTIWVPAGPANAAGGEYWLKLSPIGTAPEIRYWHGGVYDSTSDRMIVFGGGSYGHGNLNDVWVLTHANGLGTASEWINTIPNGQAGSPSSRNLPGTTYDPVSNRLIIFGGCGGGCYPTLNDVWVLTNANATEPISSQWIQLSPGGTSPSPRDASLVNYDPATNRMIVFSGHNGSGSSYTYDDVWVLTNANGTEANNPQWIQISSNIPVAGRYLGAAVYDQLNNRLITFGGKDIDANAKNAVWVLTHANGLGGTPEWINILPENPAGLPSPNAGHSAVYDSTTNSMTVFSGSTQVSGLETLHNAVWRLSYANGLGGTPVWTQIIPDGTAPSPRSNSTLGYDAANQRLVLFGGHSSELNADSWILDFTPTPPLLPSSFYGEIHINDGAPVVGDNVEAYLPGVTGVAASGTITTYLGNLVYSFDIPGTVNNEGDLVTFKINGRVVATGIWHSGTHTALNIHPPAVLPGGPYDGDAGSPINFTALANDWGGDPATYQWDWDNDGTFDATGQSVTNTWTDFGTYTVGLKVTDAQGGVGTATVDVMVNKVSATITLGSLSHTYNGTPKSVTVTTTPAGLGYSVTYDGSTTAPINAGEYAVVATITDPNYIGSASGTLLISKADTMTVVSGGGTFVYDGAPHAATVLVTGAGGLNLTPAPVYSGSCSAAPVNVSDTPCTASYTYAGDPNHNGSTGSMTISITPKPVTVTVTPGQSKVFGSADPIFAYTSDPLIGTDALTGSLSRDAGEDVGTYAITQGDLSAGNNYLIDFIPANFTISSASATVTLANLSQTYDGTPKPVTVTTSPAGLAVSITYDGSAIVPTNAGSYAVVATVTDLNYSGSASGTLVINKAATTVVLSGLSHVYDGAPKSATATTTPAGLTVDITYDGSPTAPTNPGSYAVIATINDVNYSGTASGTLVILAKHSISLVTGWNLVSFNVHPTDTNVAQVLASVAGNYDLVYAWDATGAHPESGNWLKHDNIPYTTDSLTILDEKVGFWIHMTAPDVLEVTGSISTTTQVTLSDNAGGWNLVGYPSAAGGTLPAILSDNGVGTDFTLVYAYHAGDTSDPWKLFDRTVLPFFNDLTQLTPGWGYWVKVSADHPWVVEYVP